MTIQKPLILEYVTPPKGSTCLSCYDEIIDSDLVVAHNKESANQSYHLNHKQCFQMWWKEKGQSSEVSCIGCNQLVDVRRIFKESMLKIGIRHALAGASLGWLIALKPTESAALGLGLIVTAVNLARVTTLAEAERLALYANPMVSRAMRLLNVLDYIDSIRRVNRAALNQNPINILFTAFTQERKLAPLRAFIDGIQCGTDIIKTARANNAHNLTALSAATLNAYVVQWLAKDHSSVYKLCYGILTGAVTAGMFSAGHTFLCRNGFIDDANL